MATSIRTGRGVYTIELAGKLEVADGAISLPLKLEHQGGLERIAFICRIDRAASDDQPDGERLIESVASLIERDFDHVREQALKSIRSDKKLFELHITQNPASAL